MIVCTLTRSHSPITGAFDLIITVFSDDADNSTVATVDTEVLDELSDRFENMGREQNISFTVTGVQRFGEYIQLQFVSVALVDTVYSGLVSIFSYSLSVLLW